MTCKTNRRQRSASEALLTVADVARGAGVSSHVVRFYVREGLLRPTRVAANSYRLFSAMDIKRVRFVRVAQGLGFTLAEIRDILRKSRSGHSPCPLVRDIITRRMAENRERVEYVKGLQERMQRASAIWNDIPDQMPSGEHICALIEAVGEGDLAPPPRLARAVGFSGGGRL